MRRILDKKKVFIGLSGGVDSAVSAALLKKQGYEVVGVFIKTWHPDFLPCNEEEERRDAMRIAAYLDIPFLTFDLEDVYKKEVADYMIAEYKAGRTPNPDVMCNKHIKFGAFLKKALSMGADFVATGHYAQNSSQAHFLKRLSQAGEPRMSDFSAEKYATVQKVAPRKSFVPEEQDFIFSLIKGCDLNKDQSYFLWTLKQQQLSKILFPVGNLKKTKVRKLAKRFNLPVALKKDSQGICFLGDVDLKEFLKHYIKEKKGKVCNLKRETIGHHNGVVFYTLGERHGFTITKKNPNDGAYYVIGKDIKKNILIVSQRPAGKRSDLEEERSDGKGLTLGRLKLSLENTNWISRVPELKKTYTAQIRYHGELFSCKVKIVSKTKAEITFSKPVLVASGQSCVLYDKDICLGGGVVA